MNKAITNPGFYNPDKCKTNNDGSYRAFEKHHYRIVYRFTKNIIRVLRVRHTKMEPQKY
jgi:plasmid stabilization system protein ParE